MRRYSPNELIEIIDDFLSVAAKSPGSDSRSFWEKRKMFERHFESIDFEKYVTDWRHQAEWEERIQKFKVQNFNEQVYNLREDNRTNLFPDLKEFKKLLACFRDVAHPEHWPEIQYLKNLDTALWLQRSKDLDEAHSSLVAQNWKAATVVAASVMEAMLAWWLPKKTKETPTKLSAMIDKAKELGLFNPPATADKNFEKTEADSKKGAAMCAANYRNLIHADKAIRLDASCSRASAWLAFGATLMVAEAIGSNLNAD